MTEPTRSAIEGVARDSYGRLIAYLSSQTRDVAGAEDALAEAFAIALKSWPERGLPENPAAWLLAVARRRQSDARRAHRTRLTGVPHLQLIAEEREAAEAARDEIPDRRLALIFACAHPAIDAAIRAPLILQTVLGLTGADIGPAFLLPSATMSQRLVRAKAKIKEMGIPFRIPDRGELPARLDAVLIAIYAAYSKGWAEFDEEGASPLAAEAIWLGQLIIALLPAEPEAKGMLALMHYAEARRAARRDADGDYVPFEMQDVRLWRFEQIDRAEALLREASAEGPIGRYQLEAAIQSAHVARRLSGVSNWADVLALYDHLLAAVGLPVVALNRAVVQAELTGPLAALAEIEPLGRDPRMADFQPYWATRGHLLARAGCPAKARDAWTLAIGLTADEAVRRFLQRQVAALPQN